jgi:hypothetical protein
MAKKAVWSLDKYTLGTEQPDVRFWRKPLMRWSHINSDRSFNIPESGSFTAEPTGPDYFDSAIADKPMNPGGRYYF